MAFGRMGGVAPLQVAHAAEARWGRRNWRGTKRATREGRVVSREVGAFEVEVSAGIVG